MYSFVCPGCKNGQHCRKHDTWCDCQCRVSIPDPKGFSMLKRIGAGVAVLAVTVLTLLVAPAAAQAATSSAPLKLECLKEPPKTAELEDKADAAPVALDRQRINRPCRQVTFVKNCNGTVTVTATNAASLPAREAEFRLGDESLIVQGESSKTFTPLESDGDLWVQTRFRGNGEWENLIQVPEWTVPEGCLKQAAQSLCNGHLLLGTQNTAAVDETFVVHPGTAPAIELIVLAGQTRADDFNAKLLIVETDAGSAKFEWAQPKNCVTPAPTTAPPVGRDTSNDLPATGAAGAEMSVVGGTIALFTALAGGLALWLIRRSRRQTSQSS